jgi:hypothetical protein
MTQGMDETHNKRVGSQGNNSPTMLNTLNSQVSVRRGSKLSEFSPTGALHDTGLNATRTRNAMNSQTLPASMGVTLNEKTPKAGAFTAKNQSMISKKRFSKQSNSTSPKNTAEKGGDISLPDQSKFTYDELLQRLSFPTNWAYFKSRSIKTEPFMEKSLLDLCREK